MVDCVRDNDEWKTIITSSSSHTATDGVCVCVTSCSSQMVCVCVFLLHLHVDPPSVVLTLPSISLSLSPQILKMLDSMGLSQYQEVFSSQQVNGDLLLECDDRMLE